MAVGCCLCLFVDDYTNVCFCIKQRCCLLFMRSCCMSVRLSVRSQHNSWTNRRRMMKPCTIILEVKSNIEFEDGSRTWPLTRWNWGCVLVNTFVYMCYGSLFVYVYCVVSLYLSLVEWMSSIFALALLSDINAKRVIGIIKSICKQNMHWHRQGDTSDKWLVWTAKF